jgi:hypothetical protein
MSKLLKMLSLTALLGAVMMAGGCGGGDDETPVVTNPSATNSFAATVNPDGTATTGAIYTVVAAPTGTPGYLETVRVTLPPNTVITAKNADGTQKALTTPLSFTFTAPADSSVTGSGTNGVPAPTGFTTLASTSGAVDVQITGAASATFSNPITITMPVPGKAVGEMIKVYTVTGTTYTLLDIISVRPTGFVNFDVSSLSWKVGNPNPDPGAVTTTVQPTTTVPTTAPTTIPTTAPTTIPTTAPTTIPTTVSTTIPTTVSTTVPTTVSTTIPTTVPTTVPTTISTTIPTTVPTTTTTTVPALDGAALYAANCQRCHGTLASTDIVGRTLQSIKNAGMTFGLSDAQLLAIIAVLP